ncbi:MAG: hypothetical protein JNJ77_00130 [Planctomycetia bacterium]|nr:hypothetical protein [Planctomycetia bacterium]
MEAIGTGLSDPPQNHFFALGVELDKGSGRKSRSKIIHSIKAARKVFSASAASGLPAKLTNSLGSLVKSNTSIIFRARPSYKALSGSGSFFAFARFCTSLNKVDEYLNKD